MCIHTEKSLHHSSERAGEIPQERCEEILLQPARTHRSATALARPAELLGLPSGTLRPGSPADVVVIDPDVPWILDRDELKSKCRNTPFDEARMQGRAVRTVVAGRTVYEHM